MSTVRLNLDHLGRVKREKEGRRKRDGLLPVNSKEKYSESKEDTKKEQSLRKKIGRGQCHKS